MPCWARSMRKFFRTCSIAWTRRIKHVFAGGAQIAAAAAGGRRPDPRVECPVIGIQGYTMLQLAQKLTRLEEALLALANKVHHASGEVVHRSSDLDGSLLLQFFQDGTAPSNLGQP